MQKLHAVLDRRSHRLERSRRAPVQPSLVAATLLASMLGWALPAAAVPILTFSLKIIPTDLRAGSVVEFPLVLVENRDPESDTSLFDGDPLAAVGGTLQSTQSTFMSVTPAAGFDTRHNVFVSDTEIGIDFASSAGIPVTVDNAGIIGRTEIPLGTVTMEIGAPIDVMDPPIVFRVDLASDHSTAQNAARYLGPGIQESLGGVFSTVIEFLAPIRPDVIIDEDTKRTVTTAKVKIKGTADAIGTVKSVEARVGSEPFHALSNVTPTKVTGRVKWVFHANVAHGKNDIKVRSIDDAGEVSDVAKVKVIRK